MSQGIDGISLPLGSSFDAHEVFALRMRLLCAEILNLVLIEKRNVWWPWGREYERDFTWNSLGSQRYSLVCMAPCCPDFVSAFPKHDGHGHSLVSTCRISKHVSGKA